MTPEIEAILASGATILVNAVATDAWKATRAGFTRLFGRGEPAREAAAGRRLDALVATVDRTTPDHRPEVRDQERTRWLVRLTDLVEDDPSAIDDLRSLVGQLAAHLPPQQQTWVQTNIARDSARLFATQGGTITVHEGHPPPDA
ncbi:hypothetical protein [Actinoplanes subtropicus]|uniref:hypothetical protein n=1 Tax=Actinoplanes subtropicus TaxID=543632 RepID=UPI00068FD363|nr:hypothetical protein [Actinoplanes subtropicus]